MVALFLVNVQVQRNNETVKESGLILTQDPMTLPDVGSYKPEDGAKPTAIRKVQLLLDFDHDGFNFVLNQTKPKSS